MDEKRISDRQFLPLPLLRAVSLVLSLTILVGDPSWAAGVSDLVRNSFSSDLRDLSVPSKFGTVTDKWVAPHRSSFVVLIQDLHANIGVQKNIASVIEYLYHRVHASSIYSEAAFGPCDVSVLRTFPSGRAQSRFEEKLLSKALLTGDELAAAHIGHGPLSPVKLEGIDDPLLYLANVQAFGDLVKVGPDAAREWKDLKDFLLPGSAPQLRRHLELTEKLIGLKLLDSEWLEYKDHRNLTPRGSPRFQDAIAAAERFYTAAEARNGALTDNLLAKLSASATQPADSGHLISILVTGGFHTASIAHALKQRGIGFMVVTPQVERLDQEELYLQSMTEPPHETIRALMMSAHDWLSFKALMIKADEKNPTRFDWARNRFTVVQRSVGKALGALAPRGAALASSTVTLIVGLVLFAARSAAQTLPALAKVGTVASSVATDSSGAVHITQTITQTTYETLKIAGGDTLSSLAHRTHETFQSLMQANPEITNPNRIYAGHELHYHVQTVVQKAADFVTHAPSAPSVEMHGSSWIAQAAYALGNHPWTVVFVASLLVVGGLFLAYRGRRAARTTVRIPSTPEIIFSIWKDRYVAYRASRSENVRSRWPLKLAFSGILLVATALSFGFLQSSSVPAPTPAQTAQPSSIINEVAQPQEAAQKVEDNAREQYEKVQAEVAGHLKNAKDQLGNTLGTLEAMKTKEASVKEKLKALEASLLQPGAQIDPGEVTAEQAIDSLRAMNPSRYSSAARAIRAAYPAFAQDPRLKDLDEFAAPWENILTQLKALRASRMATPSEAAALIQEINTVLATAEKAQSSANGLKALAGVLSAGEPLAPDLQRLIDDATAGLQNGSIEEAQAKLQNLRSLLTDFTDWGTQQTALNSEIAQLEKQIHELNRQLTTSITEEALALAPEERAWIAEKLQLAIGDTPLDGMIAKGDKLRAGLDPQKRWTAYYDDALASLKTLAAEQKNLQNDSLDAPAQLEGLRQALLAVAKLRNTLPQLRIFDRDNNSNFSSDTVGLSESADYETYLRSLTHGIAIQHVQSLLQAAIAMSEQQENIAIQAARRQAGAAVQEQEQSPEQFELLQRRLETEISQLKKLDVQVEAEAQAAARMAPHAQMAPIVDIASLRVYAAAVHKFNPAHIKFAKSHDPAVQAKILELQSALTDLQASVVTAESAAEKNGSLTADESQKLTAALLGVLDRFAYFVNPAYVRLDQEHRKDMLEIQSFISDTAQFSVQYLVGLTGEQLRVGAAADDSFEDRLVRLLGTVSQAAQLSGDQQKFAHYLDRTTGLQGWSWNILEALNMSYGLKHLSGGFNNTLNELIGKNPFAFQVGAPPIEQVIGPDGKPGIIFLGHKSVAFVQGIGKAEGALGAVNGLISLKGAYQDTAIVLTGKDPVSEVAYFAPHLDPKVFHKLDWQLHSAAQEPVEGVIDFTFPDGRVLRAAKTLTSKDVSNRGKWEPVDAAFSLVGRFSTVVKGQRYIWIAGRTPVSILQRIEALRRAATSALLAKQTIGSMLTGDAFRFHRIDIPTGLARGINSYLAATQLQGLGETILKVIGGIHYQIVANSPYGGWLTGDSVQFVSKIQTKNSAGESVVMRIDALGHILYERKEEGHLFLDDMDGTVQYQLDRNVARILSDFALSRRLHSVKYFQVSKRLAHAAVKSVDGFYALRRSHSAPIVEGADKDHIRMWIAGEWQELEFGEETTIRFDGEALGARPYYLPSKNPDQAHTYLGFIRTHDGLPSFVPYGKDGRQIDSRTVFTHVTSTRQSMESFRALMTEGNWNKIDDVQAQLIEKSDGWPVDGWMPVEGGMEVFVAQDGQEPAFIRWMNPGDGRRYLIDQRDPMKKMVYRISTENGIDHVELKVTSFPDYAKTKALPGMTGTWRKEDSGLADPGKALQMPVAGAGAKLWLGSDGAWHMRVEKTGTVAGSLMMSGTYIYQMGGQGARDAQDAIAAPFIRRQPLPVTVDLEALARASGATGVESAGPNGPETWYYFNQLTPGSSSREFVGAYVRYGVDGKTHVDAVSLSLPGLQYQHAASQSSEPTFLNPRLVPPKDAQNWVFIDKVPEAVQPYLGGAAADAAYVYDSAGGEIVLRVRANPDTPEEIRYYFAVDTTAAGKRQVAAGQETEGTWVLLGAALPDDLIKGMPGYKSGAYKKIKGQWYYAVGAKNAVAADQSAHLQFLPAYDNVAELNAAKSASLGPASATLGHLPPFLGIGAEKVKGHWYKTKSQQGRSDLWAWTYFEVGPEGGRYTDPDTGKEVVLDAGSVWVLHSTPAATKNYLVFHEGMVGDWSVSAVDAQTLAEDVEQSNAAVGMAGVGLKMPAAKTPLYTIPGTSIAGHILISTRPDPYAPTVLVVAHGGSFHDPMLSNGLDDLITVRVGDTLIYQIPAAQLEKINAVKNGQPDSGAVPPGSAKVSGRMHLQAAAYHPPEQPTQGKRLMALVIDPASGRVTRLEASSFRDPVMAGIQRVKDTPESVRAQIQFPYTQNTLIYVQGGQLKGQVQLMPEALEWFSGRQASEGYVKIDGEVAARVNGKTRHLSGLVAIGSGLDQLPASWVEDNMVQDSDHKGWKLKINGKTVGGVNFGVESAVRYAAKAVKPVRALYLEAQNGAPYEHEDPLLYHASDPQYLSDGTYNIIWEHLFTHLKIVEHRRGEMILSRSYQNKEGNVFKVTYYGGKKDAQYPLYSTDGAANVTLRYATLTLKDEVAIAAYAPDGVNLMSILRRDKEGHLLWQWTALSHTLETYHYDAVTINGRAINADGKREAATRIEMSRVSPDRLGLPQPSIGPYTASSDPAARKPAPQIGQAAAVDVPRSATGRLLISTTVYDPLHGRGRPLFKVNAKNEIDAVYEAPTMDAEGNRTTVAHHLSLRPVFHVSDIEGTKLYEKYNTILETARAADLAPEARTIDILGRLTDVRIGNDWHTRHDYFQDTEQMLHSSLEFRDGKVWDVYYPGFQTFNEALKGIDTRWFAEMLPASVPAGARGDLQERLANAGFEFDSTKSGFVSLPKEVSGPLKAAGLAANTQVQIAVVMSANGGVSVDYRLPNDPAEQLVMANHGADRTVSVGWDGSFVEHSYKLTGDNQIVAGYQTTGYRPMKEVIPADLWNDVRVLGVLPDTLLPIVKETLFAPETTIQEETYARTGKVESVDPDKVLYQTKLKWSTHVQATNHLYIIPNHPLGVDLARKYQWDGWAISQWWLTGTPQTKAPLGILPGSVLLNSKGTRRGIKEYSGPSAIAVRGANGQVRLYAAYQYNIADSEKIERRGEAYEAATGRLIARDYAWVRIRLANIYPVIAGDEVVYYDPTLPFELAIGGKGTHQGKTVSTKVLLRTDFEVKNGEFVERQIWREREPVVGQRWQTWTRTFINGQEQMPIQHVVGDFKDEVGNQSRLVHWLEAGIGAVFFILFGIPGWLGRRARRREIGRLREENDFRPKARPNDPISESQSESVSALLRLGPALNDAQEMQIREAITGILREIGVSNSENYYVHDRVLSEIRDQLRPSDGKPIDPNQIFSELEAGLTEWREKTGINSGKLADRGHGLSELRRIVLMEWITEEMVRNGLAGIADLPSTIFYLIDQSIGVINGDANYVRFGGRDHLATIVRGQIDALQVYLKSEYDKKAKLKPERITYDDFSDLFEDGKWLKEKYEPAFGHLPAFYSSLTPKDKPFDDKIGLGAAIRNVKPILYAVFIPAIWLLADSLLAAIGGLAVVRLIVLGLAVIPWGMTMAYLGRTTLHRWKTSPQARVQLKSFALYYPMVMFTWGGLSWFLNFVGWKSVVALMATLPWYWWALIPGSIAFLNIAFTILSIFNFPTMIGSFFSHFGTKKAGTGQIRTWRDVQENYEQVKQRFGEVMIPKEIRGRMTAEQAWKQFWNEFIQNQLRNESRQEYLVSKEEMAKLADGKFDEMPLNDEAVWRIQRAIESFLMIMPHARAWDATPAMSVMSTGFNEVVTTSFSDLNETDPSGEMTRLNKVIATYPVHWLEFVRTYAYGRDVRAALDAHTKALKEGNQMHKLPSTLDVAFKDALERWVSTRMTPLSKTVREMAIIHDAFRFFAWVNFPQYDINTVEGRAVLDALVDKKLQIFVNYSALGIQVRDAQGSIDAFISPEQQEYVKQLMREYPFIEWRWGMDAMVKGSPDNVVGRLPHGKPVFGGKPFAQNEVLPFIRHNKILFFDVNASVRWEEAIKLPLGLNEFASDPKLKFVLYGENIYNRPYSWPTWAAGLGEETWTQEEQEFLSMFGAVGFYGHSAIVDRQALIAAGGYPHQFSGEDTIMTIKFWLKDYHTQHRLYMLFGKSRETGFLSSFTPLGRWSQNVAEYLLSRWIVRLIHSKNAPHIAQLMIAFKSMSFFPKKMFIPILNWAYLNFVVFLGISGFVSLPYVILFGILGLVLNQSNTFQAFSYLVKSKGLIKGGMEFLALFPMLYMYYTPVILNYGVRFWNALVDGVGGFAISGKGFNLKVLKIPDIYANDDKARADMLLGARLPFIKKTLVQNTPRTLILQTIFTAFFMVPLFVAAIPVAVKLGALLGLVVGIPLIWATLIKFVPAIRHDLWHEDAGRRVALRIQLVKSLPEMAVVLAAIWFWGGVPVVWYYWAMTFASLFAYIIGSFNAWQPNAYHISEEKNNAPEEVSQSNNRQRFWRGVALVGFAASLISVGLGTNFASPMFLLFTFSVFYLGMPFAAFFVPFYGQVRPLTPVITPLNAMRKRTMAVIKKSSKSTTASVALPVVLLMRSAAYDDPGYKYSLMVMGALLLIIVGLAVTSAIESSQWYRLRFGKGFKNARNQCGIKNLLFLINATGFSQNDFYQYLAPYLDRFGLETVLKGVRQARADNQNIGLVLESNVPLLTAASLTPQEFQDNLSELLQIPAQGKKNQKNILLALNQVQGLLRSRQDIKRYAQVIGKLLENVNTDDANYLIGKISPLVFAQVHSPEDILQKDIWIDHLQQRWSELRPWQPPTVIHHEATEERWVQEGFYEGEGHTEPAKEAWIETITHDPDKEERERIDRIIVALESDGSHEAPHVTPVSIENSLTAALVSATVALLPHVAAFGIAKQFGVPAGAVGFTIAGFLSAMPLYAAWIFGRQAFLINQAKRLADSGHVRGPSALHPSFKDPSVLDFHDPAVAAQLGPENINAYRRQIAFVLGGKMFADKNALSNLPLSYQSRIFAHESEHQRQEADGVTSWKEPRAFWAELGTVRRAIKLLALNTALFGIGMLPTGGVPADMEEQKKRPFDLWHSGNEPAYLEKDETANYEEMSSSYKFTAKYPKDSLVIPSQQNQWVLMIGEGVKSLIALDVNDGTTKVMFVRGYVKATNRPVAGFLRINSEKPGAQGTIDDLFEKLKEQNVQLTQWHWAHFDVDSEDFSHMNLDQAREWISTHSKVPGLCSIDQIDAILNIEQGTMSSTMNYRPLESMRTHEGLFDKSGNPGSTTTFGLGRSA